MKEKLMLKLETYIDHRGKLSALNFSELPFEPKRIYFICNVPASESRGGHAHKRLRQAFICLAGSAEIALDDGRNQTRIQLEADERVTIVGPYIWRELSNFTPGTLLLVLADAEYSEEEYIRNKSDFLKEVAMFRK